MLLNKPLAVKWGHLLGRNLISLMSGTFLWSVLRFGATSKNYDLLTSSDPDINLICIKCILLNKGVHKQENEWSFVKLLHAVAELLHFTLPLPLSLAPEFRYTRELSTVIFYHSAGDLSLASKFFCSRDIGLSKNIVAHGGDPCGTSESHLMFLAHGLCMLFCENSSSRSRDGVPKFFTLDRLADHSKLDQFVFGVNFDYTINQSLVKFPVILGSTIFCWYLL